MDNLAKLIKDRKIILFAGSGVSNCLSIPTWDQLIDKMAKQLDYEEDIFHMLGDYLRLSEYYKIKKGTLGDLRSWMDTKWHSSDIKIETSTVHKLIVDLDFPIIYTTNYDRWIEKTYDYYGKRYIKIVNALDLAKTKGDKTQIIKFHGDFSDDNSLVLTESDYFERLSFESPLDIKFRSDILSRSIFFIGHSLTDINLRYIIYKLNVIRSKSKIDRSILKSYIHLAKPNEILEEVLRKNNIEPLVSKCDNPTEGLVNTLTELLKYKQ